MEFIKIILLLSYLIFIDGSSLDGPNYPTNYVAPVSGQLNLPVSQQSVGVNTVLNGVLTSQNINQILSGVNSYGMNGVAAGLNGMSGTNGIITGVNNVGTNGIINGVNGLTGLTDIQTSEIIRRQIQTNNFNALNGGGVVNPLGTTVIGANGLPVTTTTTGLNGVNAIIDPATGVTVGYLSANGMVTPITTGINGLQNDVVNNGYQVVTGLDGVNTVVDRTTGATVGYVGANGVVTPVTAGLNGLQNANVYPLGANNGYQVVNDINGVNTVIDRTTGTTIGYVGANGIVTPVSNGLQTGYGSNMYGLNTGYQGFNGYGSINPFQTGAFYPSNGLNGQGIIPTTNGLVNTGLNQYNGYSNLYPTTMGTGFNGFNPYNAGITNGMSPYYGQQQYGGYNGYYPFNGQQQFGGYPMNGYSNSNSQASASSRNY